MADNIDSLQIEITANANNADAAIRRLSTSLLKLKDSLGGVSANQFQNLSNGIRQLAGSMERASGLVKTADFTRIANGLNKLSAVNVQGVSDASRAINTLTANLSQIGQIKFDSQGIANIANSIATLGRKTVTQAVSNIPLLTTALKDLVAGLNQIGSVNFDVTGLSQLTLSISKLGGKSATIAASGNIGKLSVALKQMMITLSSAPKVSQNLIQMTQALAQLASSGGKAGVATKSLTSAFNGFSVSSKKASKSAGGLAAAFGKFYATYWLVLRGLGLFKDAIDISSDLTEAQNVVDVTFGHMSDTMNEFADSALKNYGMSELMAKQIASRFQAMGVAMGFAQGHMAEMSIELTKLAGDMASFYNVSQDQIATALQSIFTGETEPLRRFGLDLSFATVEAWALANGLEADMQKMTQAEKTMLRYQYVMANTGAASGDFLRTVNSWHNQLVLLSGAFQQLGSIVGGVLINAFKPFIQALNSVMGAVINFAQVVSDALGAIFGWEYQTGGGVANDMESAAGAAGDLEDATGGAADNAKKLNKYIAAWHEVNNMTSNDRSKGSGGGGGAGGGAGNADGGQWIQKESIWEQYTSAIDTLYELGEYISGVLTDAMNDIDWDSIYEGARNFGTGLASFLNGLISPDLFGAVGKSIAGALNTVLHGLDSFGATFEWENFGNSIAVGINSFFDEFDFGLLATTLNTWANGLLDALIAALEKIEWDDIGEDIGEFLKDLDWKNVLKKAGEAAMLGLNAAFELATGIISVAPLESAIVAGIALFKWGGIPGALSGLTRAVEKAAKIPKIDLFTFLVGIKYATIAAGIGTVVYALDKFGYININWDWFADALESVFNILKKFTVGIGSGFVNFLESVGEFLTPVLNTLINGLGAALKVFAGALDLVPSEAIEVLTSSLLDFGAFWAGINFIPLIGELSTKLAILGKTIAQMASKGIARAWIDIALAFASHPYMTIAIGIGAIALALNQFYKAFEDNEELNAFIEEFEERLEGINEVSEKSKDNIDGIYESLQMDNIGDLSYIDDLVEKFVALQQKSNPAASDLALMKQYTQDLVDVVPELSQYIDEETGILKANADQIYKVVEAKKKLAEAEALKDAYKDAYKQQYEDARNLEEATSTLEDVQTKYNEALAEQTRMREQGATSTAYDDDVKKYKEELDAATEAVNNATEAYGKSSSAVTDLNNQYNAMVLSAQELTPELKTQADEVRNSFSALGIAVSDDFAMKIMSLGSTALPSFTSFMQSLSNETSATKEELKAGFEAIGIELPNALIENLSTKEPEAQSAAVRILTSMQSGLQQSQPALELLFSSLGIDLPNELITNLANQEQPVQEKAVELLGKIEDGYTLTEPSLKTLYHDLGIALPTELTTAIESMDSSTKSQALQLLGQLLTAEEEKRPEIISRLNKLGIDNADSLISGLESKNDDAKTAGKSTIEEIAKGAKEEAEKTGPGSAYEAGQKTGNTLLDGLKSIGKRISDWWSSLFSSPDVSTYSVDNGYGRNVLAYTNTPEIAFANNIASGVSGAIPYSVTGVDVTYRKPASLDNRLAVGRTMPKGMEENIGMKIDMALSKAIDYNKLGEAVYQAQSQAMKENPVQIGDKDIFSAAQRQQRREYRRTLKTGWAGID